MPRTQQEHDASSTSAGLQNGNAAGQVIAMKRHQHAAKHTAPEIDGNRNRGDQNRKTRGLLKVNRNFKDMIEARRRRASQPR